MSYGKDSPEHFHHSSIKKIVSLWIGGRHQLILFVGTTYGFVKQESQVS
jgi:hypothetical protein